MEKLPKIFDKIQIGSIEAKNRIFMAPMTRGRATKDHIPTPIMADYYAQRASAGLIISEGIGISQEGLGWPYAPGIWSQEQVEKWKPVTKAVHDKGGKIFAQLWHMGRAAHSNVTKKQPVSSSATSYPYDIHTYAGKLSPEVARPIIIDDIKRILNDYKSAAHNAIAAGFDGIQIHGANGYLVDQFLRDSANKRTDEYGGSIENRTRFMEEVVSTIVTAIGSDRTSIRLSPNGDTQGVDDSNPEPLFIHVARVLDKYNLAFVELREVGPNDSFGSTDVPKLHGVFRKHYSGILGLNQEYTRESAFEAVENGTADFIAFGRPFIANPELVEKLKNNEPWASSSPKYYYSQGPEGYTDYPGANKI